MIENSREQFRAILEDMSDALTAEQADALTNFYGFVLKWNGRLHLTTITDPEEFIRRHIVESLQAASRIPQNVRSVWDMGTGLGVPGIPIAIVRPDLTVFLVESSRNKSVFLEEAAHELRLDNIRVVCRRIEDLEPLPSDALLTARAVEKMERLLPDLIRLGAECPAILIFGGGDLAEKLESLVSGRQSIHLHVLPDSDQRLLIEIARST